jgi:quinol monooxygenase YgiN
MGYVVTAKWTAREGEADGVLAAIEKLVGPSREEPGCSFYQPSRDPEHPEVFFIYEIYDDAAAYAAHGASAHFEEFGRGEAIPLLESRELVFYETLF